jgi:type I restriction enzyme S subunit
MKSSEILSSEPDLVVAAKICSSIFDGTHDSPKQQESGFKLVTSRHIKNNMVLKDEAYFITGDDYSKINKRSGLQIGDVLFTMIGTVGEVCRITSKPDFAIKNIGVFRPFEITDSVWIYYYLLSPEGRKSIEALKRGTTQQFMGLKELREFPIIFPGDTTYRKRQLEILELLDSKIVTNNALSKTLEDIAQTIFRSWFIDFDPVRAKMVGEKPAGMEPATAALFPDSMEDSEIGLIPKGWSVRSIGDSVIRQKVGKLFDSKTSFSSGSIPVLDQGKSGVVGFHDEEPGVFASSDIPIIVFANHTCSLRLICYSFSVIQNVFPLVGNNVDVIWLYFAVEGKQQFDSYKGHWPDFVLHKIIQPTEKATQAFRVTVEPLLKQKWLLEQQSKNLENLRDSLLPRLISGELEILEEMLAS